jgi:hypothetical protein
MTFAVAVLSTLGGCRSTHRAHPATQGTTGLTAPAATGRVAEPVAPEPPDASTRPRPRSAAEIEPELKATLSELAELFPRPEDWFDAGKRQAAAPRAIPAIRRVFSLGRELAMSPEFGGGPDFSDAEKQYLLAQLVVLGDEETTTGLRRMIDGGDKDRVAHAHAVELFVDWWRAGADAGRRKRVVSRLDALARGSDMWTRDAYLAPCAYIAQTTRRGEKGLRSQLRQTWTRHLEQQPEELEQRFRAADAR